MKKSQTEPYIATYLHAKGRQMGLPIAGNFELTARCNFDCPMCYVHLSESDAKAQGRELTAQQWLQLAKDARDRGMMFVLLTGGEPFVRKDFFEILHGMQDLGLHVSINSNGSMLSGKILAQLLERPPFRMNISLYGGCNETYAHMCGQPAYTQVKENIRALRQAGVEVSLNLSITPYNQQDLEKIYADAVELDANVRASSYMYPKVRVNGGQFGCGNRLSPEEAAACSVRWDKLRFSTEEFLQRAKSMQNLSAVQEPACPVETDEGVRCRAGSTSFWVTWDGRMLPCGMLPHEGVKPLEIGFEEAWQAVRSWTQQIRMPKQCLSCDHKELCAVCAAVTVTETGAFDAVPEYVCRQTRAMVIETLRAAQERENENAD
jgi:radical SAM protein with 4Fe4S-binding SPASM domain